jgi:hypothetical protein
MQSASREVLACRGHLYQLRLDPLSAWIDLSAFAG